MFDIGWSELVVIAVVALIAIGPKELPSVLRSVGYWMGKVRKMAAEFQGQFQEAMREAEMSDLKKHADDLNNMAKGLTSDLSSTLNSTLDPYDTAKESEAAKTVPPAPAETPAPDVTTADTGAAPLPPPEMAQVAAMPEETLAAPQPEPAVTAAPVPAPGAEAAPAPRRAGGAT
ncbi:MAG: Sec-independent protein translocase protein TatB [Xanthobacteraceae bacterium]